MLDCGALTTMTPRAVASLTSTLSRPIPARAMTLSRGAAASASASTCVALRMSTASASARAGSSARPVGSVDVADVEGVTEHGQDRRGQLLGDEDDRAGGGGHGVLRGQVVVRRSDGRAAVPGAGAGPPYGGAGGR